jgi:hypothetical protein
MLYCKNVPTWERIARVLIGLCVAAAGLFFVTGVAGWVIAIGAASFVGSGLIGFCPMRAMLTPSKKQGQ